MINNLPVFTRQAKFRARFVYWHCEWVSGGQQLYKSTSGHSQSRRRRPFYAEVIFSAWFSFVLVHVHVRVRVLVIALTFCFPTEQVLLQKFLGFPSSKFLSRELFLPTCHPTWWHDTSSPSTYENHFPPTLCLERYKLLSKNPEPVYLSLLRDHFLFKPKHSPYWLSFE